MVSTGVTAGYISAIVLFIGFVIAMMYYYKYDGMAENKDKKHTEAEVIKAKDNRKTAGWTAGIMFVLMAGAAITAGVMHKKEGSAPASAVKFYYF